jgi:hypothetical protein
LEAEIQKQIKTTTKAAPRPEKKCSKFPKVDWQGNEQHLSFCLLETVEEYDDIRKGLWPRNGEKISQSKK